MNSDTTALLISLEGLNSDGFSGFWISAQDRSFVRILYTKEIVRNITLAALAYGEALIKVKKFAEAEMILIWAEEFEKKTELGGYT